MGGQALNTDFPCYLITDKPTTALISTSLCSWQDFTQLVIKLDSTATIKGYDMAGIKSGTIYPREGSKVNSAFGSVQVFPPSGRVPPTVTVNGPSKVSSCDGIISIRILLFLNFSDFQYTLIATVALGSYGWPMVSSWGVNSTSSNTSISQFLNRYFSKQ